MYGPFAKTQLLFWCQQHLGNNLNGRPVLEVWEDTWYKLHFTIKLSSPFLLQGGGCLLARPEPQPQPRRRPREPGMRLLRAGVSR